MHYCRRDYSKYITTCLLLISLPLLLMPEPALLLAHQQEEQALLQQGKQYYMEGRFEEAVEKLTLALKLLKDKDKLIDAYLHLSLSHFALGERDKAKVYLADLLRLNPAQKLDPMYYAPDFVNLLEEAKTMILARLKVETEPPEARVILDGELAGVSPLQIGELAPGEHKLRITKEGYKTAEQSVILKEGEEKNVAIELEKVKEEKKPVVAVTPPEKKPEVKKSKSWLWILLGGAAAAVVAVMASRGGKESSPAAPTETFGSIQVKSYPNGAAIFLDGQNTGFKTNHTLTDVQTGSHTILLRLSGWKDWQEEVMVYQDQTAVVKPCLLPPNGCYRDNFQDGDADGWDLDSGWQIKSQGGNYFLDGKAQSISDHFARPSSNYWRNYSIKLRFKIVTFGNNGGLWVHIRDNPEANYHIALVRNYIHMGKHINSINQGYSVAGAPANIATGMWHNLEFTANGNNLQLIIDNRLMINAYDNDERLKSGQPVLKVDDGAQAHVDNIEVISEECP
jgi:hypothetical protein